MNATPPPAAADPLSAIGVADMADLPNKISRCVNSSARVGQKSYHSSINELENLPTKPNSRGRRITLCFRHDWRADQSRGVRDMGIHEPTPIGPAS